MQCLEKTLTDAHVAALQILVTRTVNSVMETACDLVEWVIIFEGD